MSIKINESETLEPFRYQGSIELITSTDRMQYAIDALASNPLLGFDTETRPAFKKGESYLPALLQLANEEHCYIFRLHSVGLPKALRLLLENEAIEKVGVAIRDDLIGLKKISNFRPGGFIELADIAREQGHQKLGLRNLSAELLNLSVSKKLRTTNWERPHLTDAQLRYAAGDAYLSLKLFECLKSL